MYSQVDVGDDAGSVVALLAVMVGDAVMRNDLPPQFLVNYLLVCVQDQMMLEVCGGLNEP